MTAPRLAFVLLLLGEGIQLAAIVIGGALYPGYDHLRQYISELGATGAVTGPAVSWLGFVPSGLLITAFCGLAGWILRRNLLAVVACLLLGWYGLSLAGAGLYPCAFECARSEPTLDALMHDLIGGTGYLTGVVGLALAGLSARSGAAPWLAPLGLGCAAVALLGFGGIVADVELGGLFQRLLESAMAVFLIAFGWALRRSGVSNPAASG
ncbi:DUF998 domain-containing protein [Brevundimonas subvibrioides]|uniref:DUF998 domain-containing protein n=1 Tax=Brevundimonas subvibrioides (strain ATCC 15264 / DSM 4735 / LMG 14903 / NBRC 16000 / CB 81) TaxID=633149 RepID=D9QLM9_BRESC|nr:DUF998 domain-containing protein [Brevundimonas subvibrioides]ADL01923.1 conserved hypothetical protein [Brevundimonas subvibrioides ATCC 15264]